MDEYKVDMKALFNEIYEGTLEKKKKEKKIMPEYESDIFDKLIYSAR